MAHGSNEHTETEQKRNTLGIKLLRLDIRTQRTHEQEVISSNILEHITAQREELWSE